MAQQADLILLGGGASGMMAAVTAGEILRKAGYQGKILLLEGASKAGRKLLATGNGRCNLSNLSIGEAFYRGDVEWASPVLRQFPAKTVIRRFEKLGLLCRSDSEGRVYPYNLQASAVLEILRLHLASLETEILCDCFVTNILKQEDGFRIEVKDGRRFSAKRVILALGGKAAPKLGGTGSGSALAAKLGHSVIEEHPALTPLLSDPKRMRPLKGMRCRGTVSLLADGKEAGKEEGEVQFTGEGLSGICVFQLSGRCGELLAEGKTVSLALDLMPDRNTDALAKQIAGQCRRFPDLPTADVLCGFVNQRVGREAVKEALGKTMPKAAGDCSFEDCRRIAETVKRFTFPVTGCAGWDSAQVTAGGVPGREVDPQTMESRLCPGLYLTGELLNVDGLCGGYNLHWAWSTGILAGTACANSVLGKEVSR